MMLNTRVPYYLMCALETSYLDSQPFSVCIAMHHLLTPPQAC